MSPKKKPGYRPARGRDPLLISVDPGGVHVGVAAFDRQDKGWGCVWVAEMRPDQFEDWLATNLQAGLVLALVVEKFTLFADKALEQTGSEMETSQLIGAIRYIHRREAPGVPLVWQRPADKAPAFAILARKKYRFTADRMKVTGQHVRDAEVHGVKYIMDTLGEPILKNANTV